MHEPKPLIAPIDRDLLKAELEPHFIRHTNKGGNDIYICNHHNAPNVMQEIGRLREVTFRAAGGGTGEPVDIDAYDISDHCYDQLIVYSPEDNEMIGGYRFIDCNNAIDKVNNVVHLSTAHYFEFSDKFIRHFLPQTIELGRSWVQPAFQPAVNPRKGLFALDNIWDGLGAITVENPHINYFFGKVTMYTHFNREARDLILYFLKHYFPDYENLLHPFHPIKIETPKEQMESLFINVEFADGFKILNQTVRNLGENIPPLVNIYMGLSRTMKTFGTAANPHFGDVEETGMMITINDIYPEKKERHVLTYKKKGN
ncbi:MAG: GNAT family N-acetyltransferase [Flavobacteriaceae bacterium]|nr:GNAT family N-acetyltransferase [Flavobacteriaceae bacterium]